MNTKDVLLTAARHTGLDALADMHELSEDEIVLLIAARYNVCDALADMYELSEDEVDEFVNECLFGRFIVFCVAVRECLDNGHATQYILEMVKLCQDAYNECKSGNKEDD